MLLLILLHSIAVILWISNLITINWILTHLVIVRYWLSTHSIEDIAILENLLAMDCLTNSLCINLDLLLWNNQLLLNISEWCLLLVLMVMLMDMLVLLISCNNMSLSCFTAASNTTSDKYAEEQNREENYQKYCPSWQTWSTYTTRAVVTVALVITITTDSITSVIVCIRIVVIVIIGVIICCAVTTLTQLHKCSKSKESKNVYTVVRIAKDI